MARGLEDEGIETRTVYLRSYLIHPCTGCEQCRRDGYCSRLLDGMHLLYPLIEESRCLVLGSPTYNYNVTPEVKSFIDRLYPYFDFSEQRPGPYRCRLGGSGRFAALVGICEQREESEMGYTMPFMRDALGAIGYEIAAELPVTGHFSRGAVKRDTEALQQAFSIGKRLGKGLQEDS
jgi:multimeric flavodoxin WrbA